MSGVDPRFRLASYVLPNAVGNIGQHSLLVAPPQIGLLRPGLAKLQGLDKQLELTGDRYNIALVRLKVFYIALTFVLTIAQTVFFIVCITRPPLFPRLHKDPPTPAVLLARSPVKVRRISPHGSWSTNWNVNSLVLKKFRPSRYAYLFVTLSSRLIRPTRWLPGITVSSRRI